MPGRIDRLAVVAFSLMAIGSAQAQPAMPQVLHGRWCARDDDGAFIRAADGCAPHETEMAVSGRGFTVIDGDCRLLRLRVVRSSIWRLRLRCQGEGLAPLITVQRWVLVGEYLTIEMFSRPRWRAP
jgi:hypothetical protein